MQPTEQMIEAAAIAAFGGDWSRLSTEEKKEWRERIERAVPWLTPPDEEAPTEVLEHPIPGQNERDPLSRIAAAMEIGAASVVEAMQYVRAFAERDPAITQEIRRIEREAHKPTFPPP